MADLLANRRSSKPQNRFWGWKNLVIVSALTLLAGLIASSFYYRKTQAVAERDSVLLADFVNLAADPVFDGSLKRALAVDLEQSPYISVFPEENVRRSLRLMGRGGEDRLTADVARELCIREGLKALLAGQIASEGRGYRITLEALSASTGKPFIHEEGTAAQKNDVLPVLHETSLRVRKKLGESIASIEKFSKPLPAATTASLEALQAFALGEKKHAMAEELGALEHYKRAVELDPNFAMAYARLGVLYHNLGAQGESEQNLQKAFDLRQRATEHEKLYITAHYYADSGQLDKGIEAYELYKQTYPKMFLPYNNLAIVYAELGQYPKSLENAQMATMLPGSNPFGYSTLAEAFAGLNRLEEARAAAQAGLKDFPRNAGLHMHMAVIAWAQDRTDEMSRELAATEINEDGRFRAAFFKIGLALTHGQLKEARALVNELRDQALQKKLPEIAADVVSSQAINEAAFQNREEALARVNEALKLSHSLSVRQNVAVALAFAGQDARALQIVHEDARQRPHDTLIQFVDRPLVEALVQVNKGNPAKAIDLLDGVMVYGSSHLPVLYVRGLAYLRLGRAEEAAEMFQRIQDLRGTVGPDFTHSLAQLGMAQAYALQGEHVPSRIKYQDLLALWKDADANLPQLKMARQEYARLQG